jgi:hypothetical protein
MHEGIMQVIIEKVKLTMGTITKSTHFVNHIKVRILASAAISIRFDNELSLASIAK